MKKLALREIIDGFQGELEERARLHEEMATITRRITFLSKHGIMAIHRGAMEEAKSKLREMEEARNRLEEMLSLHRDLFTGFVKVALQEYAEAHILLALVEQGKYPNPGELKMPAISYILGLADSVGEFRRRALSSLLDDDLKEAERCLSLMEEIYGALISLEKAYVLAPELRRKCDIARRVIEATMSDIMVEDRSNSLRRTIKLLEERVGELKREEKGQKLS